MKIWYSAIMKEDINFQPDTLKKEEEKFTPSYAFSNTGLINITIPASVTSIEYFACRE